MAHKFAQRAAIAQLTHHPILATCQGTQTLVSSSPRLIQTMIMSNPTHVQLHQDAAQPTTTENGIANEERKFQELMNKRTDLTIAMMLLHQNTKDNRMELAVVNADMHKTGERLKRLHRMSGDIDYLLPKCCA